MKILLAIIALAGIILLCDRYEQRLPPPISWVFALWKKCSHALGQVMSTLILTVLWIIGIGTYAIILKLIRLFRKEDLSASGWHILPPEPAESITQPY